MPAPSTSPDRVIPAVQYLDTTPVHRTTTTPVSTTPVSHTIPTTAPSSMTTTAAPTNYATPSGMDGSIPTTIETLGNFSIMELVQMFVVYAFVVAAALSAIFIFIGGISFILSGGSEEKITKAVNTIRYAIVGLIVTILSFTFVTIVGRMFGLNFLDYLSYAQIKTSISQLMNSAKKEAQQTPFTLPQNAPR